MKIVLASASPRRKELIKKLDYVEAKVVPSNVSEDIGVLPPEEYVKKLAFLKASEVYSRTGGVVVGADTVVTCDGKIYGKPKSFSEADQMFKELCGKTHSVITGLYVTNGECTKSDCVITYVTFGKYDDSLVHSYIMSGSPFDKAGGYGLQDPEIKDLIVEVVGDKDNVVGLPVSKLDDMLKQFREIIK